VLAAHHWRWNPARRSRVPAFRHRRALCFELESITISSAGESHYESL
jgi:hypothetical protein